MIPALLSMVLLATPPALEPRVQTLRFHLDRLKEFQVADELREERSKKFSDLAEMLAGEIPDASRFNEVYQAMDEVRYWLWEHASNRPHTAAGEFVSTPSGWRLETPDLALDLEGSDFSISIESGETVWEMAPCEPGDLKIKGERISLTQARSIRVEEFRTGFSLGLTAHLSGFPDLGGLEIYLSIHLEGKEAVFELVAKEEGARIEEARWPNPITLSNESPDNYSVLTLMQGALIPSDWPRKFEFLSRPTQSRYLYMPWWGQVQGKAGVQTIIETFWDAGVNYRHPEGGPTHIELIWKSSLGSLRYPRRVRLVFDEGTSYVKMAKRYRRRVEETGRFVSLREKKARTPALSEVIGKPVIHTGALYHNVPQAKVFQESKMENNHNLTTFEDIAALVRKTKENGIEEAYVHLDGWGFYGYDNGHPDILPPGPEQGGWEGLRELADTCDEIGYLLAFHDQYRDFYFNAASYDDRLVAIREDGSREFHSTWCGGPQVMLSAHFAPGYVRRNYDLLERHEIKVKGAYLDVFAVAYLDESFQDAHPMSREDCARFRMDCLDLLRARGFVVSSEEPVDYAVSSIDLAHHAPYYPYPNFDGNEAFGYPVPLFNLVYHDSILTPWYMSEAGGWGIPKDDSGRLHCLLNAGLPYVGLNPSPEEAAKVKEAAGLAEKCGMLEMTGHEFLDEDRRRQRTTFADGTQVTVDFGTKEYAIKYTKD